MSERVKLLGGTLCISSEPGAGTCIAACVPLEEGWGKR
jgi:signal transduction histidine kinase